MEVVSHDAVGQDPHGDAARRGGHKCKECSEIGAGVKDRFAVVAAVDHVLDEAVR
jgi:hypothetical protein